jgi:hypothetical protein
MLSRVVAALLSAAEALADVAIRMTLGSAYSSSPWLFSSSV